MKLLQKLFYVLLTLGLLNSTAVFAEEAAEADEELLSAGELLNSCDEGYTPGAPTRFCMKYVGDFVFMIMAMQQAEQSPPIFCINPQVHALEDVTEKVHTYLRSNSSRSKEAAQDLVIEALNKGYPCSLGSST